MLAISVYMDREDQWVHIIMPNGERIRVAVNAGRGNREKVVLIFDAPREYTILRQKLDTEYLPPDKPAGG